MKPTLCPTTRSPEGDAVSALHLNDVIRVRDEYGDGPFPLCGLRIKRIQRLGPADGWTIKPGETLYHLTCELISHPGKANEHYHVVSARPGVPLNSYGREIVVDNAAVGERQPLLFDLLRVGEREEVAS